MRVASWRRRRKRRTTTTRTTLVLTVVFAHGISSPLFNEEQRQRGGAGSGPENLEGLPFRGDFAAQHKRASQDLLDRGTH
ncbi:hypothetical protein LZ31DRAFT_553232 [Colletotrichum somersetense]|nr:hypothetical protein LZ31DRAFT_553232 [Colletotrichum somersetense]